MKGLKLNYSNGQLLKIAVTVVIVAFVFLFIKNSSKAIRETLIRWGFIEDDKEGDIPVPPTPLLDGEPTPVGFDPMPIVTRLHEVLTAWMFSAGPRCEALKKLYEQPPNSFILVCNTYNDTYGKTLRSDLDGIFQSGCSVFSTNYYDKVIEKMDNLGVMG